MLDASYSVGQGEGGWRVQTRPAIKSSWRDGFGRLLLLKASMAQVLCRNKKFLKTKGAFLLQGRFYCFYLNPR